MVQRLRSESGFWREDSCMAGAWPFFSRRKQHPLADVLAAPSRPHRAFELLHLPGKPAGVGASEGRNGPLRLDLAANCFTCRASRQGSRTEEGDDFASVLATGLL